MVNNHSGTMDDSSENEDECLTIPVSVQEEVDQDEDTVPFDFQHSNDVANLSATTGMRKANECYNMR